MRLCVDTITISDVIFSDKTVIENGVLYVNVEELTEKISDPRFESLTVELAKPGESCRITWIGDIIQPRVKKDAPEHTYPGVLGKLVRAGEDTTVALDGVAVVELWKAPAPMATILDMSGPGAEYTPFSKTNNIIINANPAEGVEKIEYAKALKKASLSASVYLASAAIDLPADKQEVFDLDNVNTKDAEGNDLPRVAYIYQVFSTNQLVEPLLYGDDCRGMLPNPVQPNEILDGALLIRNYDQVHNAETSYVICNHPVIKELYERNGKDINFAGVILKTAPFAQIEKERFALMASTQAKYVLNADAVILTKEGGGHPQLDMALTCDNCEALGIKSVMILTEFLTTGGGRNESLIFNTKNADAIISAGYATIIEYPSVMRLIGEERIPDVDASMRGPFKAVCRLIRGSLSQVGNSYMMSVEQ